MRAQLRTFLFLAAFGAVSGHACFAGERSLAETITLEDAYARALATDQSIRIAYLEVRKANLLPWSALTRLGPQLTGSSGYARSRQSFTRSTDTIPLSGTTTSSSHNAALSSGITLEQPLIDLTVFPAYRLGKLSARAARLQHRFTIRGTLFGVATAYYEVLKLQQLVTVNKQTLDLSSEQLDLAQKRADVGEVTRSDVLRARVSVENARRALVESENTLLLDRNTLGNILNLAPESDFRVIEPREYSANAIEFAELWQRALGQREDLRAQAIAIDEDIQRRNEVIGEYGPRVVSQISADANNSSGTAGSRSHSWDASISVQVPFFTGGQREIDLLTATRQIEQTRLQRDQLAKTIEQDVRAAWLETRTLSQTLEALKIQVAAAEQSYEDLRNQYRAGTATSVDVLSALNDLNTSRKDFAVERYDYQVALRKLEQVSGGFENERVEKAKAR